MNWLLLALVMVLVGCGSTTDRQTKTVEVEEWVAGPMVVDTFAGQVTVQPTRIVHQRTQYEVEKTQKTIDVPEAAQIITAAAGGTPVGAIAGVVGLLGATAAAWKATQNARQRDEMARDRDTYQRRFGEVVEGVEHAKDRLDDAAWDKLTESLERKQSRDTMDAVRKKTS